MSNPTIKSDDRLYEFTTDERAKEEFLNSVDKPYVAEFLFAMKQTLPSFTFTDVVSLSRSMDIPVPTLRKIFDAYILAFESYGKLERVQTILDEPLFLKLN